MTVYKDIKDIAKETKAALKQKYPGYTWSVKIDRFSGGQSMKVALISAPFEAFANDKDCNGNKVRGYAQLNHYQFLRPEDGTVNNGTPLTREAWDCMAEAYRIASRDNWDHSDRQTDYFDVNYWLSLDIGRWDKSFIKTS